MPGTLQVDITANYTGDHRICWRIGTSGPYDCTTIITCAGLGLTCSAFISVDLTPYNIQCDDIIFEGYAQPICYPESAISGRIPFAVVYTPIWPCVFWEGTKNAGAGIVLDFGDDCAGNPVSITNSIVGKTFYKCGPSTPIPTSPDWTITENTLKCCYDCKTVDFKNTFPGDSIIYYIDCVTLAVVTETVAIGVSITRCIVNTSETVDTGSFDITYLADC
tara:strand:- start:292 stop:951 length:660 start_codon:yes stop_codon:yes gene_type:complete